MTLAVSETIGLSFYSMYLTLFYLPFFVIGFRVCIFGENVTEVTYLSHSSYLEVHAVGLSLLVVVIDGGLITWVRCYLPDF